jgi:tRNA(Arg) A34 adenosine deaminase TadA
MARALAQARSAAERGEVPIGAVIVGPDGEVLAEAGNRTEGDRDPTAHAELLAIRAAAARLGAPRWSSAIST